ncbi:hypothetical protein NT6N_04190 [Oceaniferula spumae]|uniref:Uncharacterized protein n=1 Tax=Oceaniferula spumae TaxID=2979115 RepID=A0AAT9FHE5_9BACT
MASSINRINCINRKQANKAEHTNPLPVQSRKFQMIPTLNPEVVARPR